MNALRNSLPCAPDAEEAVIDFESAICQAVRETLPEVHMHECYFLWAQAVHRRLYSLGLQTAFPEKWPLWIQGKQDFICPNLSLSFKLGS